MWDLFRYILLSFVYFREDMPDNGRTAETLTWLYQGEYLQRIHSCIKLLSVNYLTEGFIAKNYKSFSE